MIRKSTHIEDDLDWLKGALDTAQVYQSDIFDVVSTVRQVQMLEHNQNYINSIKVKIAELEQEHVEALEYEADDEQ